LPHYVTFRSMVDRKRALQDAEPGADDDTEDAVAVGIPQSVGGDRA